VECRRWHGPLRSETVSASLVCADLLAMSAARIPVILVVDDEASIRRALTVNLATLPARVLEAATAKDALVVAGAEKLDLVVLDLGLPDRGGIEVCSELRRWSSVPIVVLSARHAEAEKIRLLNAGADDYVSKPFALGEFIARVQAHLRRASAPKADPHAV